MFFINPHPPTRGREKEEKGERFTKINIKIFTNNANNTNNSNNERNNAKYAKPTLSFSELGARALASHQRLPARSGKSWTGLSSRQELDSGMHG